MATVGRSPGGAIVGYLPFTARMQGLVGWVRLTVVHRGEELALASEGRRGRSGTIELWGGTTWPWQRGGQRLGAPRI